MGCNMNVHIEVKKDGVWHHYGTPRMERDYFLFAVIGGERLSSLSTPKRDKIRPVASIKQLPKDISLVTQICYEQDELSGVHNVSVLTPEDLRTLQDQLYELQPWIKRTGIDELDLEHSIFKTYINGNTLAQHQGWDDLRVICWFEN